MFGRTRGRLNAAEQKPHSLSCDLKISARSAVQINQRALLSWGVAEGEPGLVIA